MMKIAYKNYTLNYSKIMLTSEHQLFKLKNQNNDLTNYARYYNHVYHTAYKLVIQQNIIHFHNYFIHNYPNYIIKNINNIINTNNINNKNKKLVNKLNYNLLINHYLQGKVKLPDFIFDLFSDNKKSLITNKLITSRQLNSIRFQLKGNLSSLYELTLNNIESTKLKIKTLKEDLKTLNNKIEFHIRTFHLSSAQLKLIKQLYPYYLTYINKDILNNKGSNNKSVKKSKTKYKKFEIEDFIKNYSKLINNLTSKLNIENIKLNEKACDKLFPLLNKKFKLQLKINQLKQKLHTKVLTLLNGKLPICFGTKKLFHKQFNLKHYHKDYTPQTHDKYFKLWKEQYEETRNNAFYLTGAKAETAGNQSCIATLQTNGLIELKIRKPDYLILNKVNDSKVNNKLNENKKVIKGSLENYIILSDLDFKQAHNSLIQALENKQAVHYRFEKNTNRNYPKYGLWTITFQVDLTQPTIMTNQLCGAIGIDLNQEHISLAEINTHGNLTKTFDIPLKLTYIYNNDKINDNLNNANDKDLKTKNNLNDTNTVIKNIKTRYKHKDLRNHNKITDLTTNQSKILIEKVVQEICQLAKNKAKPIVIEKLDFEAKKKAMSLENKVNNEFKKKRNKQLSSFIYSKFKQALISRAEKDGIELIQVNPAYTSVLGLAKYQKIKGISTHQAASYVIGRRGLGFKEKICSMSMEESLNKDNNIEINNKRKKEIKFIERGHVIESTVPVRKQSTSGNIRMTLLKDLSKNIKEAKIKFNAKIKEKLKQAKDLEHNKKKEITSLCNGVNNEGMNIRNNIDKVVIDSMTAVGDVPEI